MSEMADEDSTTYEDETPITTAIVEDANMEDSEHETSTHTEFSLPSPTTKDANIEVRGKKRKEPEKEQLEVWEDSGEHVYSEMQCRRALAEFIICDEMPFAIVEKHGFRQLVKKLEPQFPIPSRTTVARDCWQLYLGEIKIVKNVLKKCSNRTCLTANHWTSDQNFNYLCLTAHFIDDDWRLHKRILNFCMIEDLRGHTIGKTVEKCLREWDIDKVLTITMDDVTGNDTALAYIKKRLKNWEALVCDGDYLQVKCYAHVLNLLISEGLKVLKNSFDAIRNAIRFVHSSSTRFQKFKHYVELERLDTNNLVCLDVETKWNSTYLMLESALKFEKVFERVEEEDGDYCAYFGESSTCDGPPRAKDWNRARVFFKLLRVFYDITLKISSSVHVTSSTCFHQIARIHMELEKNIVNDDPLLMDMFRSMKSKYDEYWLKSEYDDYWLNPLLIVAVILDPRYKLVYVNHIFEKLFPDSEVCVSMKKMAKDALYRMFDEYYEIISPETGSSTVITHHYSGSSSTIDDYIDPGRRWFAFLEQERVSNPHSELDKYLASFSFDDIPFDDEFDILSWWKANSGRYKVLSLMARDVLAMPVSTLASNSVCSIGGCVLDSYRSSLAPRMTEALICAQDWLLPEQSLSESSKPHEFDNYDETHKVVHPNTIRFAWSLD
ncbi:hypothetical protein QN277_001756 [Acacia crassicarpa]|uniref:Transposase n=1 Tax=Acacia crassicarpa TaxID=499986 RepID=A0AAE1TH55_9FABA|nr:hypothetical protein QN277_001756 [Acacia crassicarpa]